MPTLFLDSGSFNHIQVSGSTLLSGSVIITGSLVVNGGSGVELQVTSAGVNLGNIISDTHNITGSLRVSGSTNLNGNLIVSGNTTIGDATTDSITMNAATMSLGSGTGILNIDSNTLVVNGSTNRVGIGKNNPNSALDVNGNVIITGSLLVKPASGPIIDTANGLLFDSTNNSAVYWSSGLLVEPINGFVSVDWTNGWLRDLLTEEIAIDWQGRFLYDGGGNTALSFTNVGTSNAVRLYGTSSFALTASSVTQLNQDVTLNGDLIFGTPTSPGFNGEVVKFGAGTLTTGQLYFLSSSGTWSLANANSTGSSTGMLGLAVGTSPTTNGLLIRGFAASSSYTQSTGSILYMATSSGIFTQTSPSSSNHVVRVIGYKTTISNTIYFDPDKTWVTLA